jgi:hypothetical protein
VNLAIDVFIAWYLLVILCADRPSGSVWRRVLGPFDRPIDAIGLRQHWSLFAPDPATASTRLHVIIHLATGEGLRWEPPRMDGSRWQAWVHFRRRLFEIMLATVGGTVARRAFAGYLMRTYLRPGDAAVALTFVRQAQRVADGDAPAPPATDVVVETIRLETAHAIAPVRR